MKTVLVLGINGSFGKYVARALARQGWQIKALMRDPRKLPNCFQGATIIQGNASNVDDVRKAAENVSMIVYGVNPANYDWDNKALPWLDVTATIAEEKGLTIIFPGNVYSLNPKHGPVFSENTLIAPSTSKGMIRRDMENRLQKASKNGAKVIIVRCGDFIGKETKNTWLNELIKPSKKGTTLLAPGPRDLKHTWAYLPDVATTVAELVEKSTELPTYNIFHFKGHRASFNDISAAINKITHQKVKTKNFPWIILVLLSSFSKLMRELLEMRYLWKEEILLDESKLNKFLGHKVAHTSLMVALVEANLIETKNKQTNSNNIVQDNPQN